MSSGINWDKEFNSLIEGYQKKLTEIEGEKLELERRAVLCQWQIISLLNYKNTIMLENNKSVIEYICLGVNYQYGVIPGQKLPIVKDEVSMRKYIKENISDTCFLQTLGFFGLSKYTSKKASEYLRKAWELYDKEEDIMPPPFNKGLVPMQKRRFYLSKLWECRVTDGDIETAMFKLRALLDSIK
jgi:hypothetical protein